MLLALLQLDTPILSHASINLNTILIRLYRQLNARVRRPHPEHFQTFVLHSRRGCAIGDEGVVNARAARTTEAGGVGDVAANCGVWLSKIQSGALCHSNAAIGDEDAVGLNVTLRVREIERIVQDGESIFVDVGAQRPVNVVREHDGSGIVEGD